MAPPGDARQCLAALAPHHPLAEHLHRRFRSGTLRGHAWGNILLASLHEKYADIQKALDEAVRVFGASPHEIIPATAKATTLVAHLTKGRNIVGEHNITASQEMYNNLTRLALLPKRVEPNPRALRALREADAIVVGPGNFYSSIMPVFLVPGVAGAFAGSRAKKIFVTNLMTLRGHTDNFTPKDFIEQFEYTINQKNVFDAVLYNTRPIPVHFRKFARVGDAVRIQAYERQDRRYRGVALADLRVPSLDPADPLAAQRTLVRHDTKNLAKVIMQLI